MKVFLRLFVLLFMSIAITGLYAEEVKSSSGVDEKVMKFAPKFDYTVADIEKVASEAKNLLEERLNAIVKVKPEERTFDNTVKAYENGASDYIDSINIPTFLAYVSTDKDVRDAASKIEEESGKYLVEVESRKDIFEAIDGFAKKNPEIKDETDKFLLDRTLMDFKRSGLALPDKELEALKELKKKAVELELKFQKNLREFKDQIEITIEQLAGLPEDYIKKLNKTEAGKYIVTLDYPDYLPFMNKAKDDNARKELQFKFDNRCASDNLVIFEDVLALREKMAKILGYKNHASFVLEDRMAKTPETVTSFLTKLRGQLAEKGKEEIKKRLALKAKETGKDAGEELAAWEWRYWFDRYQQVEMNIDHEKIKEYFPLEIVMSGMLAVYEEVLDVKFQNSGVPTWHEDVRAYEVKEKNGDLIGFLYLDLFPRDGKYKHAACFPLVKGMTMPDGTYRKPSAAVVANFNKPSADAPSLFKHSEVETLFHEFGHVIHNLFTTAKYSSFSGTRVVRDFVEVPSTILENWVWDPAVLKRVSGHYKNNNEKLPDEIIKKMIEAKNIDSGITQLRQTFFSLFDMACHTTELTKTTELYEKMMKDIMLIPMTKGTNPQASFGHLIGGYDAGYYGYQWARVISSDLFSEFEKNGILNPKVGKKFKDYILSTGRVADHNLMVEKFLGRPFNEEAYLKYIGLKK
ncbi:MAG: Zn-dependent oligopeptidase [Candidatus Riflebacteria bacterium]|nr:Zn-dependent oligopeptidase [Candidatus Riflebacteria bacterium]